MNPNQAGITTPCGGSGPTLTDNGGADAGADLRDSDGTANVDGAGNTGVEFITGGSGENDHTIDLGFTFQAADWGDLPDSFDTLSASGGPSHTIGPDLYLGVCVDSCHLFAAGFDLRSAGAYDRSAEQLVEILEPGTVRAWHLNDSRRELGSRRDRHADLGQGEIGWDAFHHIVCDDRWAGLPGCLETPGGPGTWARDIATLRAGEEEP